ncbi:MAG: EAL domain-containing protein [Spirochaetaceae bacterium]|nr:MAG: EAL domain-containing protein [Spirochaetaceae bacterium]
MYDLQHLMHITPLLALGILGTCTLFFVYLAVQVSKRRHLTLAMLSAAAFFHVLFGFILSFTSPQESTLPTILFLFQRLIGTATPILFLLFLRDIVTPHTRTSQLVKRLIYAVMTILGLIVIASIIHLPLFWHNIQNNPSLNSPGILWIARDAVGLLVIAFAVYVLIKESTNRKQLLFSILILAGVIIAIASIAIDYRQNLAAIIPADRSRLPLSPVGITLFLLLSASAVIKDFISQSRELNLTKDRLAFLAYHDDLTGLMNRQALTDRLQQAIAQAQRSQSDTTLGLLMMDLDHFKRINDGIGHDVGDQILTAFANRVKNRVRSSDFFFRIGGDEFAIVLTQLKQPTDAAVVSEKILSSMEDPFLVNDQKLYLGCTIGISIYPKDAQNADQLMIRADSALSEGKRDRNIYRYYTMQMQKDAARKMQLLVKLRAALHNDEFHLVYQPQIAADGSIIGAEALLRWNNPEIGSISPAEFIPMAEETGAIMQIGSWVIEQACAASHFWESIGLPSFPVAVNLSARQLRDERLVSHISGCLRYYGLRPDRLHIEITESSVLDNPEAAIAVLHRLNNLGVHIAIDDFGTGFSSLSYLKELPVDCVKIDRSFFLELPHDNRSSSLLLGIISMIEGLGLSIIAEGVESEGQISFLQTNAPIVVQGYFYSRPLPQDEFIKFVKELSQKSSSQLP